MKILILGGTRSARELADALVAAGHDITSSLAGRTTRAVLPAGEVRVGHFGGVAGLEQYLRENGTEAIVNATHPFAAGMSANAFEAAKRADVPHLRLTRSSWRELPGAGRWHWVEDHNSAARLAADHPGAVLLTVGRQHVAEYIPALSDRLVIARVVDPPDSELPSGWEVLATRGPFTPESEATLMTARGIGVLVSKDSGGSDTQAKLAVAAELGIPVVMIARPEPLGERVASVTEALAWVSRIEGVES